MPQRRRKDKNAILLPEPTLSNVIYADKQNTTRMGIPSSYSTCSEGQTGPSQSIVAGGVVPWKPPGL